MLALVAGTLLGVLHPAALGAELTARVVRPVTTAFVGEPIAFKIQISGSEKPEQPDLSQLVGFRVKFGGGTQNSSFFSQTINGRTTRTANLGYILSYQLTATKAGRLVIPPIEIVADGKTAKTQQIVVTVQEPFETEEFKLRRTLDRNRVYVGEQIPLEVVFFYTEEKPLDRQSGLLLNSPFEGNPDFELYDVDSTRDPQKQRIDGKAFSTSRVRRVIVPKRAGKFAIEPATLAFVAIDGYELVRDRFGRTLRQGKRKKLVIPTEPLEIEVLPLPAAGKPANFGGHVGEYTVSVQASAREVNVGDPITLNISLSGPTLLEAIVLPPLDKQESLTKDFKVPSEIEDGTVNGAFKIFTQTVRAKSDAVTAIPPIELVYFDTAKGSYKVAQSAAIPIVVRPTKVLTALDVEGLGPVSAAQTEVQALLQGIAHNYSDAGALSSQLLGFNGLLSPGRLAIVAGPPLVYAILLAIVGMNRRRNSDPESQRARKALGGFNRDVARAGTGEEAIAVMRRFLGDKLALTSDALTYRDVEDLLRERGVEEASLAETKALFAIGEASRFAGGSSASEVEEVRQRVVSLVKELEKSLR